MNLICGINPVLEALGAGTRHFDRLLVVKGLRNKRISDAISRAGHLGIPLRFEARETLDRMAAGVPHQGLIAVVSAKPVTTVEKVLEEAHTPALVVVLDGVEDPRNLGAILRTVEAAGAGWGAGGGRGARGTGAWPGARWARTTRRKGRTSRARPGSGWAKTPTVRPGRGRPCSSP